MDVIEKLEGPTPWTSPIVVVPKKAGGVRICVDMREPNKAIRRERHSMPTFDDLVADLNGSTLELDESSHYITTFTTHVGRRRFKRLLFGVNAAAEIFQNAITEILSNITGAQNFSDDIIVHGKTQSEHDISLRATLQKLEESGAKVNREKCVFSTNEMTFFGHVFGANDVSADPNKIKTIINTAPPENISEVRGSSLITQP
ncbi:uncharacterized protein K02A2.6-like [Gigantopelta aegis]|uniref:uncharacterized protein K02A2.6-like n=1 Tax=Gigantopelta aegis TaxID=1735272 RepID=UPI001B887E0D|nr:uncharacterized protein K02A2.6-like [Gigantopelta aegis]